MWNILRKEKHKEFNPPNPWIDIHTHILFGLDDGAKTIKNSLEMVRKAEEIGVTHIIATPHCSSLYNPSSAAVNKSFFALTESLKKHNSKIKLLLGREMNFLMYQIKEFKDSKDFLIKDSKNHALIELPEGVNKTSIIEGFFELMIKGIHPIIAHPERNSLVEREPEFIRELQERDFLIQVDAGSIIGNFGKKTKQTAWTLFKKELVDIVSSDAHTVNHFDNLKAACNLLANSFGNEYLKDLICNNPLRILQQL